MPVSAFQDKIKRAFSLHNTQEINELFNDFFNSGVFGVAVTNKISHDNRQMTFRFGYICGSFEQGIHASVDRMDLVAVSPMFHEYCGCVPSRHGAVIPAYED